MGARPTFNTLNLKKYVRNIDLHYKNLPLLRDG